MSESQKWFQKLFYKETVLAIKSSLDFLSYESFKNDLALLLPQESKASRIRIANNILHRFFGDKTVYQFLPQIWQTYEDELLLQELIRYELLKNEPVLSEFVLQYIHPASTNEKISSKVFSRYIEEKYKKENQNLSWWLQSAMRDLGFIHKSGNNWLISKIRVPETALILLLHKIFAQYPSEIEYNKLIENDFWKLIGIKDPDIMKNTLFKAHLLNIINFNNEIIRTNYSLENLLTIKPNLNC